MDSRFRGNDKKVGGKDKEASGNDEEAKGSGMTLSVEHVVACRDVRA